MAKRQHLVVDAAIVVVPCVRDARWKRRIRLPRRNEADVRDARERRSPRDRRIDEDRWSCRVERIGERPAVVDPVLPEAWKLSADATVAVRCASPCFLLRTGISVAFT